MNILVTGGAGFVGSHLVDRLLALGHRVIVVDHQQEERERFLNPKATFYKQGIGDEEIVAILQKEKPEAIVHLAAQISVIASMEDPAGDAQTNIIDALSLVKRAAEAGVKKFVFASSGGAIYGECAESSKEVRNTYPLSPYGIAKQSFEYYLEYAAAHFGLSTISLRFSNIYGPRQMPGGYAGVMSIFIDRLLSGKEVTIFGDGSSSRDYVFVEDAVDALVTALQTEYTGVVNVSTGVQTTVDELWTLLQGMDGSEKKAVHAPVRPGEVQRSVLSPALAARVLPWKAKTSLQEGLKKTYAWFKERR